MNVAVTNEINNGVFSTAVKITSFGGETLTAQEELNILDNYSSKVRYKDLDFSGYFKVVEGHPVLVEWKEPEKVEDNTGNTGDKGETGDTEQIEGADETEKENTETGINTQSAGTPVENLQKLEILASNISIPVNPNFLAAYKTSLHNVLDEEIGEILKTPELVCQAKCILFASVVKTELKRIVTEARKKANSFEGTTVELI